MIKKSLLACSFAALASCGGNVKDDNIVCSGIDWDELGYKTVMAEQPVQYFNRYKQSCGDRLEANASALYQEGYLRGAIEFCTEQNGYDYGSNGRNNPEICPFELKKKFDSGFKIGMTERREQLEAMKRTAEQQERASASTPRHAIDPGNTQ